jgi:hypothetical protein
MELGDFKSTRKRLLCIDPCMAHTGEFSHDPGFTLREYGHVLAGALSKVAASLDAVVMRARGQGRQAANGLQLVPKPVLPAIVPASDVRKGQATKESLTA